jgi:signal transduction histidine kinase
MTQANAQIAGRLSARFRRGMLPLAVGAGVLVTLSAPVAYYLLKCDDLRRQARMYAEDLAARVRDAAEERGDLWRYDTPKLLQEMKVEHARESERDIRAVEIVDPSGHDIVPAATLWPPEPGPSVRGGAPVLVAGQFLGTVNVFLRAEPALRGAGILAVAFAALGFVLGVVLYLWPLRLFREEDLVRALMTRALTATEEERLRLSHELHDGVAQALGASAIALARIDAAIQREDLPGAKRASSDASQRLEQGLEELRRVARALRPTALDDLGLAPAIAAYARQLSRVAGFELGLELDELPRLPDTIELCCYRLAQEALTNAARHAHAHRVRVTLRRGDNNLTLRIEDDGKGFSPSGSIGLGLVGARERITALQGNLELVSAPGAGTRLTASLPLEAPA